VKIATGVGAPISEFSYFISNEHDLLDFAKPILLCGIFKPEVGLHGIDLGIYSVSLKIETMYNVKR
jgi:hypothetical protein